MDNVNITEPKLESVNSTNAKAIRSKQESTKGIRKAWYEWRIGRKTEKLNRIQSDYKDYKEMSGADSVNFVYEWKLRKLNKKINNLTLIMDNPGRMYNMYSKLKSLALSVKQIKNIKDNVRDYVAYNKLKSNIDNEEIKENIDQTFKQGNKTDDSNIFNETDPIEEEKVKDTFFDQKAETEIPNIALDEDVKNEDNDSLSFNLDDPIEEEKVKDTFFDQKAETKISAVEFDEDSKGETSYSDTKFVGNDNFGQSNNNDQIIEDINKYVTGIDTNSLDNSGIIIEEPETVITDEEVKQDLDIHLTDDAVNKGQLGSEVQIAPERNFEYEEENKDRSDRIGDLYRAMYSPESDAYFAKSEERMRKINDLESAMNGPEADKYFDRSLGEIEYQRKMDDILNSSELTFEQKREALNAVKNEYTSNVEAKQQQIEQRRQERINLEQNILNSLVDSVKEERNRESELDKMLQEENQELNSLQEEYASMKGAR